MQPKATQRLVASPLVPLVLLHRPSRQASTQSARVVLLLQLTWTAVPVRDLTLTTFGKNPIFTDPTANPLTPVIDVFHAMDDTMDNSSIRLPSMTMRLIELRSS